MSSAPLPVALFSIDAAELELVQRGIDEGWLPTMAAFVRRGRCIRLTPMPSKAYNTAWACITTGTDLGDHEGLTDQELVSGTYRLVDVPADWRRRPPFWRYVSDAGLRSVVASIYGAPLLDSFRGAQVLGWGTADPHWGKFGRVAIDPPQIRSWLREEVGRKHTLSYIVKVPRSEGEYLRYRDTMLRSVHDQERTLGVLLERAPWQFFFGSFGETHQAGHLLWHLGDPAHPLHDPSASEGVRDALPAIYRAIDSALGRLMAKLPPDCRVFLVNPHGMGPNFVDDPADTVLTIGGWMGRAAAGGSPARRAVVVSTVWSAVRHLVPERLRLLARMRLPRDRLLAGLSFAGVDWSATRAFSLPSDLTSSIRVNLAGREPEGIVQQGPEYERLLDDLARTFGALELADAGLPAVEAVIRCGEFFGRPVDGPLPDLLVVWANTGHQIRRLHSRELGTFDVPFGDPRTGQHRQTGFLIGAGPGIPASGSGSLDGRTAGLLDVAPTALALLGVTSPPTLRGRPIPDFLDVTPATSSGEADRGHEPGQADSR